MFSKMAQQLELQTLGKGKKDFKISKQEFEQFCKDFLFEELNIEKRREFLQILKNQLVDLKIFLAVLILY
jgi:hypothetical protein